MSKHVHVELDQDERQELEHLLRSDRSQGQKRTDQEVAAVVLCSPSTVLSIRHRYVEGGLSLALNDKGWPAAVPKLTGEVEAKLTMLACSEPPAGYARWTLRLLANQMVGLGYVEDVSHVTVRAWLKKTNLSLGK